MPVDPVEDILKRINDSKPDDGSSKCGFPTKLVDEMFFLVDGKEITDAAWMQITKQNLRRSLLRSMACMLKRFCEEMGVPYP